MPQSSFNPHSADGNISSGDQATWAAARGATTGTTSSLLSVYSWRIGAGSWFDIRTFLSFDTSSLSDDATVSAVTLRLYRNDSLDGFFNADTVTLHVVPSSMSDPTSLAAGDFDNLSFTSKGSLAHASTSNNAYNDITVNVDQISLTGYTKLALIDSNTLNNVAPTGRNTIIFEDSAASNPPVLQVTYTLPDSGGGFIYTSL